MTVDGRALLDLLPAVHRLRDAAVAGTIPAEQGPLESFLDVLADQLAVLDENLDQLYDDQFIETCTPWVVPYIGDQIGYRLLHGLGPGAPARRAEVAHTIALRRRKGTVSVIEQLSRDVTLWEARAVEFFQLLATTQFMNHLRPDNQVAPSPRDHERLGAVGTAFDAIPRTLDVRRIATGGGRYNIPNVGIFLWRIGAQRLRESPATADPTDAAGRRFRFSPLGHDSPLYTRPELETEITHLAEPINVPDPIGRRVLADHSDRYYGDEASFAIGFDGVTRPVADIAVCHLGDDGAGGWAHDAPAGKIAVDPVLGRLVVAADVVLPAALTVTHHYGSPGAIGGGEYQRTDTFASLAAPVRVPDDFADIQSALDALGGSGVVEITDNGHYAEALTVSVADESAIELRAADERRPTVELTAPMKITGGSGSSFALNGLLVTDDAITVPAVGHDLRRLTIAHTTCVPGLSLGPDGAGASPGAPSLQVARAGVEVTVDRSILGAVRVHGRAEATLTDSVLDAGDPATPAYTANTGGGAEPGGALLLEACTVIGRVRCASLSGSNSILLGLVDVTRRQAGCLRFSYAPLASTTPRRYRCQPDGGPDNFPRFTSLRYGAAGYGQLRPHTPGAIRRGADDESEMGVQHFLFAPQRESDLRTRLDEYLRVGLEAGVFYES